MNRLDGFRSRCDLCLDLRNVEVVGDGVDIDKDGYSAKPRDGADRSEKAIRCGDDLVAGTDVEGHQREQDGIAPRSTADGILGPAICGQFSFELSDLAAEDKCVGVENTRYRGLDLGTDRLILFF